MSNGDITTLLLLVAFGISAWMIVLFVRLCSHVKAIKTILMTACDLEEFRSYGSIAYRKKRTASVEVGTGREADLLR